MSNTPTSRLVSLREKYAPETRVVQLTGVQAILRMLVERSEVDRKSGLRTAAFVSGYPGSPLGGLETLLAREKDVLKQSHIIFQPGLNEEVAVTSVMGSQIANGFGDRTVEGIAGLWFGKTPGLDRALDGLKHANAVGAARLGGAIAIVGDDPDCKSSTIPNSCELTFRTAKMPLLVPADVSEVISMGVAAFEMSRETGLWVGLKLVTDIADGGALVEIPEDYGFGGAADKSSRRTLRRCFPPESIDAEVDICRSRLPAAQAFAKKHSLDRIIPGATPERIGVIAAGKTFTDVRLALDNIVAKDDEAPAVRLLKLGLVWPLDATTLKDFAAGLELIVVIEEKSPFIQEQVQSLLYNITSPPTVIGKRDRNGVELFPEYGALDADTIFAKLRLIVTNGRAVALPKVTGPQTLVLRREAWFCSGCPHNRSTVGPAGISVGGGIGCHTLALGMDRNVEFITQMGGEGAAWIGIAPFVERKFFLQNIGDGTFFHSGSLSVRAAIAAGANITFKILRNSAIAMTGGQRITGARDLRDLCGVLASEGVSRIHVVAEDVDSVRDVGLPKNVSIHGRGDLESVQRRLLNSPGVNVLVYDQQCAIEKRRVAKRDRLKQTAPEVYISTEICDSCGDCGKKSNCISVGWTKTALGRKARISSTTCNYDYSCVDGECPSFFMIKRLPAEQRLLETNGPPDAPICAMASGQWRAQLVGIGGSGVVTVSSLLTHAAWIESLPNVHLDQTGMAQKGGAVVSHVIIGKDSRRRPPRVGRGECDLVLAFDPLAAVTRGLATSIDPRETVTVLNLAYRPSAREIGDPLVQPPVSTDWPALLGYDPVLDADRLIGVDTDALEIASTTPPAYCNVFMLGVASQRGLFPVHSSAIEQAIRLNGVDVTENLNAFTKGRWWAVRQGAREAAVRAAPTPPRAIEAAVASMEWPGNINDELTLYAWRLAEYHSTILSEAYLARIKALLSASIVTRYPRVASLVAQTLFDVIYIKDEYEVARLALAVRAEIERDRRIAKFSLTMKITPLRVFGTRGDKWSVPEYVFVPIFWVLARLKFLRYTVLDPFSWSTLDRKERALPTWFEAIAAQLLSMLTPETELQIIEAISMVSHIRGYGGVKNARILDVQPKVEQAVAAISRSIASSVSAYMGRADLNV